MANDIFLDECGWTAWKKNCGCCENCWMARGYLVGKINIGMEFVNNRGILGDWNIAT